MADREFQTDLFIFFPPSDKEGLKINKNNSVCENMDWQKGKNTKWNSGLRDKSIYMQASFHTPSEIKIKARDAGAQHSGCFEAIYWITL